MQRVRHARRRSCCCIVGPRAAELVGCDCVLLAETKNHADWELVSSARGRRMERTASVLNEAVEEEEDEHFCGSLGG
jgi:hypothetical protein